MLKEFKAFIMRGNVVDLAVAVILGAAFGAIINSPQASILAVGQAAEKVVARDGEMVIRRMMTATLSVDHRVVDGALGALYLKELKALLEHPLRLLF